MNGQKQVYHIRLEGKFPSFRFGALILVLSWVFLPKSAMQLRAEEGSYQEQLLLALLTAKAGQVIEIPEGVHSIDTQLSLAVDGVTLRGKGMDRSILSFKGQTDGAEGLHITASGVLLEGFAIEDTKGDAIKINGADGVTLRGVAARWTRGPARENGAYGFYPVKSRHILIESCLVSGASDAGIYVGQSENVIVRRNHALLNVAGIEVENSRHVDVYHNYVERNTGGILVFNMPDLQVAGEGTRVFGNTVIANNTENFAPPSNAVADVPTGTGVMVTANKKVEIFDNFIADNHSTNILLVSYGVTGRPINDPNYDPYLESIYIYENTLLRSGQNPRGGSSPTTQELVEALKAIIGSPFPHIIYDGSFNPKHALPDGSIPAALKVCLRDNYESSFINLDLPHELAGMSRELGPHLCRLPHLPPVVLPEKSPKAKLLIMPPSEG